MRPFVTRVIAIAVLVIVVGVATIVAVTLATAPGASVLALLAPTATPMPTPTPDIQATVAAAIQATRAAEPTATRTPVPPTMTPTPAMTSTPAPPTPSPTPTFQPITKKLGPIRDGARDEEFSVEVTVTSISRVTPPTYRKTPAGKAYLAIGVEFKNLGPGAIRYVSRSTFGVLSDGAVLGDDYLGRDCDFRSADLQPGGKISGCITFEVPESGRVALIYAPYKYEGLKPGRYVEIEVWPGASA